jgi:UDP-glucose 4-epimerase
MMKILITGGAGFIARNLAEQLNSAYDIVSPNSKELNLLDSQKVFDYIKSNPFDVIIHTATYDAAPKHSTKDPGRVLENNLKMFFNLARCKDYFGRMFYFGSGAEFDRLHWAPKMKEDYFDQHVPQDQYGFSKYIMTKQARLGGNIYNLRLFGVFGKYDDWRTRFIPNACRHAALGLPVKINQNKFFDFLYIDDLVKIVKWFINNKPEVNIYNACTGSVNDFKSLAEKVIEISGKKLDIIIKATGLGQEYSGDNSLLLNELKGFQFTPIDKAVTELYHWHDANKHLIEKEKL